MILEVFSNLNDSVILWFGVEVDVFCCCEIDSLLASMTELWGGGLVILKHTTASLSSEC